MVRYKNIDIENQLVSIIRHMSPVEECREALQNLQANWDNLALLGQLSGTSTDISGTRQAFHALTASLINQLALASLKKAVQEMGDKAKVAIDILVRNLFERTADIGFLATDEDIRQFIDATQAAAMGENPDLHAHRQALRSRFAEYVAKYSVYSDIILLSTTGEVLARLDDRHTVPRTCDALLDTALHTGDAYVEIYRHIDLLPDAQKSLVYAYRVADDGGNAIGVLCLVFRFENEVARIFHNLGDSEDWAVFLMLDEAGRVIASSDRFHIPPEAHIQPVLDADYRIVRFGAQEYIAASRRTSGYQGYEGPGWYGHIMLPLQHAFSAAAGLDLERLDAAALAAVKRSPTLFGKALQRIPLQAEHIQRDLNRAVWNGNVRQSNGKRTLNTGFSKVLLWEISNTGSRTKAVFERSIANLHETIVSARLQECRLLAALAIDIMDRNLYERANDCRWWALTSAFRSLLAAPELAADAAARIGGILHTINSLYTVYSNLLVFDACGQIIAVSRLQDVQRTGRALSDAWVRDVLALGNSQGYAVSAFSSTPLYGERPTYIYGAAILAPDGSRVVGGVGIIFDAAPQFTAMLNDALPRDESGIILEGCFGLFIDSRHTVIASTASAYQPGDKFDMTVTGALANCAGGSAIIRVGEHFYALGLRKSSGYREYKGEGDSYQNEVSALVFVRLCDAVAEQADTVSTAIKIDSDSGQDGDTLEIATFCVGSIWYGLRATDIIEAVDLVGLTGVPGAGAEFIGYVPYRALPIPVYDIRYLAGADAAPQGARQQVIILRKGEHSHFGIVVDRLGDIPEISTSRISPVPPLLAGGNVLADALVDCGESASLLLVLGVRQIAERLASLVHAAKLLAATGAASA